MSKLMASPQAEEWCIGKHLLSASMRLMECGNKSLDKLDHDEYYDNAYVLYTQFFNLNKLPIVEPDMAENDKQSVVISSVNNDAQGFISSSDSFVSKAKEVFKRMVDCCTE